MLALAHDLGNITKDGIVERVLTLGIIQDRVIQFAGQSGKLEPVPGLWSSYYPNETAAVVSFYHDYAHALDVSARLDEQIRRDSEAAAGREYALITTLAVRQTFGALQYAGTPAKPYIFLKEISSNSDIQTVDVIFPAYPIFLYLNATLGRFLLEPLFENQESGAYPNAYAEHDLGTFPIAKGYPAGDDEPMPLEECGNMIIMALAYAQRTGDNEYLAKHYKLLSQWAEFLVNDSLIPASQLSTDDFAGTLAYVEVISVPRKLLADSICPQKPDEPSHQGHHRAQGHVADCAVNKQQGCLRGRCRPVPSRVEEVRHQRKGLAASYDVELRK